VQAFGDPVMPVSVIFKVPIPLNVVNLIAELVTVAVAGAPVINVMPPYPTLVMEGV
jgi:hypothetical protein